MAVKANGTDTFVSLSTSDKIRTDPILENVIPLKCNGRKISLALHIIVELG